MIKKKLIVITGASSGFGAETAKKFSKLGYPMLLIARRLERLQALNLPNTLCKKVDILNRQEFKKAILEAENLYGPTDCLINNAGVMLLGETSTQDPKEFDTMIDVNIKGLLNGTQLVLQNMKERNHGTIINISSVAGRRVSDYHSVYCGTKFAVHAITEQTRKEVAPNNVRVIVIAPGAAETELLDHTTNHEIKNDYKNWKKEIGGAMSAEDVANAIVYTYQQPQEVCIREVVIAPTRQIP